MIPEERRTVEWECARLINLYANLNDAGRWSEVAALYTEDGRMFRPSAPDVAVEGRDAILESFLARPARYGKHFCTNIVVDVVDADNAHAESRILLFVAADQESLPLASPPLIGAYHDRFRRTTQGWRFAERRGSLLFRS